MKERHPLRRLQIGLLLVGLLLLASWSVARLESRAFQSAGSVQLEAGLRAAEAAQAGVAGSVAFIGPPADAAPTGGALRDGVLGRIEIPRLRITAIVGEGVDAKTLRRAVGHVPWTALPGRPGNCALAGHRDTFLRGLGAVRENDVIRLVTLEGTYTYAVEWGVVVEPRRVDVLDSTDVRSLTLVTCYPFDFVGSAPQRFVVRARLAGLVAGAGSRSPEPATEASAGSD